MILLRLKVSNLRGEGNKPVQVTTAMLDVIPSPGAVSVASDSGFTFFEELSNHIADPLQPPQNIYGPPPDLSPEDLAIIQNRDPDLGQPIGKGDAAAAPILLAKLARGQEIELTCKAYKVSLISLTAGRLVCPNMFGDHLQA